MSIIAYAALTTARENQKPDPSPPEVKTYVDALAALVPAEVLALHAVIISLTTTTTDGNTSISDKCTLCWAFWGLVLLSMGLYIAYRLLANKWDRRDWARMFIPPCAFVCWTMLQRLTAFDAVAGCLESAPRTVIALFLAVILGVIAAALAYKANQKEPLQP